jgi:hypothetical protein
VLALAFGVLIVAMVMAGSLSISGLSEREHDRVRRTQNSTPGLNACQQLVVATHGSMLPSDRAFART